MPWSLSEGEMIEDPNGVSWTEAIKQQRAFQANESRVVSMYEELDARPEEPPAPPPVPGLPSFGPKPKIDERLQAAMELISEFTQDPPQPHPIHVTVENDNSGMEALVAALGQITERLMNGEKVSESLVASLQTISELPAPVVNVEPPVVNVPAPIVNVPPANITVRPHITLPASPNITKTITFERDFDGRVTQAEVAERSE